MSTERKTETETEHTRQKKTAMRKEIFIGGLSIVSSLCVPAGAMLGLSIIGPASLALNVSLSLWILSGLGAIAGWAIAALYTFKPTPGTQKLFAGLALIAIAALTAFLLFYNGPSILSFIVNQLRIIDPDRLRPNELAIGLSIASVVLGGVISLVMSLLSRDAISLAAQSAENSHTPTSAPELCDTASLAKENSPTPAPAPELRHTASLEDSDDRTPPLPQSPASNDLYPNLLSGSRSTLLPAPSKAPAAAREVGMQDSNDTPKPHHFSPVHYGRVN